MMIDTKDRLRVLDLAPAPDLWRDVAMRFENRSISPSRDLSTDASPPGRSGSSHGTSAIRRGVIGLAAAVAILGGALLAITAAGSDTKQSIIVVSANMQPTLEAGQEAVLDPDAYKDSLPSRGDVVAFRLEEFPEVVVIERVIGLPGDRIEQVDGIVYIDGEPLDEPYAIPDHKHDGAWTVDPGHLFVMGDNRPNSNDSRIGMGQIPIEDLEGQVLIGETPVHDPLPAPPAPVVEVS